jgi:hypothetical protein
MKAPLFNSGSSFPQASRCLAALLHVFDYSGALF